MKRISVKALITDLESGLDRLEIMFRHDLSYRELQSAIKRLIEYRLINDEVVRRLNGSSSSQGSELDSPSARSSRSVHTGSDAEPPSRRPQSGFVHREVFGRTYLTQGATVVVATLLAGGIILCLCCTDYLSRDPGEQDCERWAGVLLTLSLWIMCVPTNLGRIIVELRDDGLYVESGPPRRSMRLLFYWSQVTKYAIAYISDRNLRQWWGTRYIIETADVLEFSLSDGRMVQIGTKKEHEFSNAVRLLTGMSPSELVESVPRDLVAEITDKISGKGRRSS